MPIFKPYIVKCVTFEGILQNPPSHLIISQGSQWWDTDPAYAVARETCPAGYPIEIMEGAVGHLLFVRRQAKSGVFGALGLDLFMASHHKNCRASSEDLWTHVAFEHRHTYSAALRAQGGRAEVIGRESWLARECCGCGEVKFTVCNLWMIPLRKPDGADGWSCPQCGLDDPNGAIAVLCDDCFHVASTSGEKYTSKTVVAKRVCDDDRVKVSELVERFDHAWDRHPEMSNGEN